MTGEGDTQAAQWRRTAVLAVKLLLIGGIFAYLVSMVLRHWSEARARIVDVDLLLVLGASALHLASMAALGLLWCGLMRAVGEHVRIAQGIRMQWLAALGKFIPGRFATTVGKVYLGRVEGKSRRLTGMCCAYEMLFCVAGSSLTVLLAVLFGSLKHMAWATIPVVALMVVVFVCVHPRAALWGMNYVLRRLGADPVTRSIPHLPGLLFAFGYAVPYVLSGVSQFVLVRAFVDVPWAYLPDVTGLTALSVSMGYVALFAPSGLGVRDGLLTWGLKLLPSVSGATAALVALAGRLIGLALDAAGGLIALALYGGLPRARGGDGSA